MAKRLFALLLTVTLVTLGITGCSDDESESGTSASRVAGQSATIIRAKQGTATLEIERAQPGGTRPAEVEDNTWTVFLYLCGSDLESEQGSATEDLAELVGAAGSDQVQFVVQTGGAKSWNDNKMDPDRMQRFLVQDGSIQEVDSIAAQDMGESGTLADFLAWGVQNYPADHMGVILWNHGGGSISGVCFDERNDDDSLVLRELDDALAKTLPLMWKKLDFVGFDACLMGTLETANVLASYADYLYGSEEMEPGTGWEYSSIMEHLAKHPKAGGAKLGRAIADAYVGSIEEEEDRDIATFSVVDLAKIDPLLQAFHRFSEELYEATEDAPTLATVARAMGEVDNYGGNNRAEGYTNMVDLGGLVTAAKDATPSANEVLKALDAAVLYHVEGASHSAARGLSVYYPLQVEDAQELALFEQVCTSPYYLSFVDRQAHGATYAGGSQDDEYEEYDDSTWFDGDGLWEWLWSDEDGEEGTQSAQDDDYWDYVDEHSDESSVIAFEDEPQVDDEGIYWFSLTEEALDNTASVSALVYMRSEDDAYDLSLGETYDVNADWDKGVFEDAFDGQWLSLPDGQNLCVYVAESADDYVVYTSPVMLNGRDTNLRIRQNDDDGSCVVEGAWDGIGEDGASARGITKIVSGDKIVPLYDAYGVDSDEETTYEGETYVVKGKLSIDYGSLGKGTYTYGFCIDDVFGDYYLSDTVEFAVDKKGNVSFVS